MQNDVRQSPDGVLRKLTTKREVEAEYDLARYPLAMQYLALVPPAQRIGPIVTRKDGLPYQYRHFQERWRIVATAAGVPRDVWNRDSRAGGITEGSIAGADIEHLRHHANHRSVLTTARYSRQTLKRTAVVADLRTALRAKRKTGDGG